MAQKLALAERHHLPQVQSGPQASSRSRRLCYARDSCGTHVYPQAGTILQDSRTQLVYWFRAIFLMATTRMGIAAKHLEREVGCSYKTAWRMMRMIPN